MHHACHAFNALKYWVRVVGQNMEQKKTSVNKKKTCISENPLGGATFRFIHIDQREDCSQVKAGDATPVRSRGR